MKQILQLRGQELGCSHAPIACQHDPDGPDVILFSLQRSADVDGNIDALDVGQLSADIFLQYILVVAHSLVHIRVLPGDLKKHGIGGEHIGIRIQACGQMAGQVFKQIIILIQIAVQFPGYGLYKLPCNDLDAQDLFIHFPPLHVAQAL